MAVDPAELIMVAVMAPTTAVCILKVVWAFARRIERGSPSPELNSASEQRLARIEHAVDAMSLEVERIAEGQRYLTKVLGAPGAGAGRGGQSSLSSGS